MFCIYKIKWLVYLHFVPASYFGAIQRVMRLERSERIGLSVNYIQPLIYLILKNLRNLDFNILCFIIILTSIVLLKVIPFISFSIIYIYCLLIFCLVSIETKAIVFVVVVCIMLVWTLKDPIGNNNIEHWSWTSLAFLVIFAVLI